MTNLFWWIRQIVLISISVFFVYFGIRLLISSYELNDPFTFLMTFFASNFIILISGTLIIGFAYRMIRVYKQSKNSDTWFWCCNTSFGKTGVTHISIKLFLRRATAEALLNNYVRHRCNLWIFTKKFSIYVRSPPAVTEVRDNDLGCHKARAGNMPNWALGRKLQFPPCLFLKGQ